MDIQAQAFTRMGGACAACLDQCFRQANLKELSRDPVFFEGFLNKIREDSVKISGRAEENEAARAAEGCTERKKGHERINEGALSLRV